MTAQSQQATVAPPNTTPHHWVMTVQTREGNLNTRSAIVDIPQGFSRAAAFRFVSDQFQADFGTPLTVLFWSLEPNHL